jgi:hypothetical protein
MELSVVSEQSDSPYPLPELERICLTSALPVRELDLKDGDAPVSPGDRNDEGYVGRRKWVAGDERPHVQALGRQPGQIPQPSTAFRCPGEPSETCRDLYPGGHVAERNAN